MYGYLVQYMPKKAAVIILAIVYAALIAAVFVYSVGADAEFRYMDI